MPFITYDLLNLNHYYSHRLINNNNFFILDENVEYIYYTKNNNNIIEHENAKAHRFTYITADRHPGMVFPPYYAMYVCNINFMILFVTPRLEIRNNRIEVWGDHFSLPPASDFTNLKLNSIRFNIIKFHYTTYFPNNIRTLFAYFSKNHLDFSYFGWSKKIKRSNIRGINLVEDSSENQSQRLFRDIFNNNQIKLIRDIFSFPIIHPLNQQLILGGELNNNKKTKEKNIKLFEKKYQFDFIFAFKIFYMSKWHITINLFYKYEFLDRFLIISPKREIPTASLIKLIKIYYTDKTNVFFI